MSRPMKVNEVPVAPFNLRELGPMKVGEIELKLQKPFRAAGGADIDTRATVDKDPCPDCGALVEWAYTSKRDDKGDSVRYVYSRCRGKNRHRWDFRHAHPSPPMTDVEIKAENLPSGPIPPPRPSAGYDVMSRWINGQLEILARRMDQLKQIQELTREVSGRPMPSPLPSPNGKH